MEVERISTKPISMFCLCMTLHFSRFSVFYLFFDDTPNSSPTRFGQQRPVSRRGTRGRLLLHLQSCSIRYRSPSWAIARSQASSHPKVSQSGTDRQPTPSSSTRQCPTPLTYIGHSALTIHQPPQSEPAEWVGHSPTPPQRSMTFSWVQPQRRTQRRTTPTKAGRGTLQATPISPESSCCHNSRPHHRPPSP